MAEPDDFEGGWEVAGPKRGAAKPAGPAPGRGGRATAKPRGGGGRAGPAKSRQQQQQQQQQQRPKARGQQDPRRHQHPREGLSAPRPRQQEERRQAAASASAQTRAYSGTARLLQHPHAQIDAGQAKLVPKTTPSVTAVPSVWGPSNSNALQTAQKDLEMNFPWLTSQLGLNANKANKPRHPKAAGKQQNPARARQKSAQAQQGGSGKVRPTPMPTADIGLYLTSAFAKKQQKQATRETPAAQEPVHPRRKHGNQGAAAKHGNHGAAAKRVQANPNALDSTVRSMVRTGKTRAPGLKKRKKLSTLKKRILRSRALRWSLLRPGIKPIPLQVHPSMHEYVRVQLEAPFGRQSTGVGDVGDGDLDGDNTESEVEVFEANENEAAADVGDSDDDDNDDDTSDRDDGGAKTDDGSEMDDCHDGKDDPDRSEGETSRCPDVKLVSGDADGAVEDDVGEELPDDSVTLDNSVTQSAEDQETNIYDQESGDTEQEQERQHDEDAYSGPGRHDEVRSLAQEEQDEEDEEEEVDDTSPGPGTNEEAPDIVVEYLTELAEPANWDARRISPIFFGCPVVPRVLAESRGPEVDVEDVVPAGLPEVTRRERRIGVRTKTPQKAAVRDYVDQALSVELDEVVSTMLTRLMELQERLRLKDQTKSQMRRRLVFGFREVLRGIRSRRCTCVVVAYNIEEGRGVDDDKGIDKTVQDIIEKCSPTEDEIEMGKDGIPIVFALTKKRLGKALMKRSQVSAVGIYSADGAFEYYKQMLRMRESLRSFWASTVSAEREAGSLPLCEDCKGSVAAGRFDCTECRRVRCRGCATSAQVRRVDCPATMSVLGIGQRASKKKQGRGGPGTAAETTQERDLSNKSRKKRKGSIDASEPQVSTPEPCKIVHISRIVPASLVEDAQRRSEVAKKELAALKASARAKDAASAAAKAKEAKTNRQNDASRARTGASSKDGTAAATVKWNVDAPEFIPGGFAAQGQAAPYTPGQGPDMQAVYFQDGDLYKQQQLQQQQQQQMLMMMMMGAHPYSIQQQQRQ